MLYCLICIFHSCTHVSWIGFIPKLVNEQIKARKISSSIQDMG